MVSKIRSILHAIGMCGAFALTTLPGPCRAADKVLRIGYILSPSSQLGVGTDAFAAEVAKRTAGRYAIEAYSDAMLGGEVAMMRNVRLGALDLAFVTGAALPNLAAEVGIFNIPFLFAGVDQARRVFDGPIGDEYLAKIDAKGVVALAWGENGMRHLTNSRRDIATPDDLKGLRLRLPQSDAMTAGFKALGADVQQLPFNEVYGALQSGRVDGEENPIATILSSHFSQVQSHLTLSAHSYDPAVILMARDTYDALSPEDKESFREAARLAGRLSRESATAQEQAGVAALRAQGMTVTATIDRAAFAAQVQAARPRWEAMYGAAAIARIERYAATADDGGHPARAITP